VLLSIRAGRAKSLERRLETGTVAPNQYPASQRAKKGRQEMDIAIYVAIAENGVIGRDGGLPWRLSTDLRRFKADTMGKPIVMGRKTWESFPKKPLPGRQNIVITRDRSYSAEGAALVHSLEEALTLAKRREGEMAGAEEICVIGGSEIFARALPLADRLHVTHVLASVEGDVHFPSIDPANWRLVSEQEFPAGERDSFATRYSVYQRQQAGN
jgi:dihydrofolate reductase